MIHSLMMFLAPEPNVQQATPVSPPAPEKPATQPGRVKTSVRFMAGVAGNAIGFGALLAGCWFSLQLMQLVLV